MLLTTYQRTEALSALCDVLHELEDEEGLDPNMVRPLFVGRISCWLYSLSVLVIDGSCLGRAVVAVAVVPRILNERSL